MCGRRDDSLLLDDMVDAVTDCSNEAVKRVRRETRARFPDVNWKQMAGTRDRVTHHYEGIDWEIVTRIITQELPVLLPRLIEIRDIVRAEFDAAEGV